MDSNKGFDKGNHRNSYKSDSENRGTDRRPAGKSDSSRSDNDAGSGRSRGSYEKKPYRKTEGGDSETPRRSYGSRDGSGSSSERKPYTGSEGSGGSYERKPYRKPEGSDSDSPRRSYGSRDGASGSSERKPYTGSKGSGGSYERKPYHKPEGSDSDSPRRSYGSRDGAGGSSERKPYTGSEGSGGSYERKPYRRSEGSDSESPRRSYGSREGEGNSDGRSFGHRDAGSTYERKPYKRTVLPEDANQPVGDDEQAGEKKSKRQRISPSKISSQQKRSDADLIRLNKYLAHSGVCSRREADKFIQAGLVKVNGQIITELGYKVDPTDKIQFEDQTLHREKLVYVLLNKPKGYITSLDDPYERKTVMSLVENAVRERIYPVGRLDRNTTGLLLFTNDGELAKKLTHPSHKIKKIYHITLDKNLERIDFESILNGVDLEDGVIKPDAMAYVIDGNKQEIGLEIHSGKNRIVRRIFEHFGYQVEKLDRVKLGGLTKKDLPRGKWRFLTPPEITMLKVLS